MERPRQHVMEDESEHLLKTLLPSNWIIRKIAKDYGVDYEIEIVDDVHVTGMRIWVQLKSKEECTPKTITFNNANVNYFSYPLSTKNAKYALKCGFPLLLFLADLDSKNIYYLNIRDEITEMVFPKNPSWIEQETITLRVPEQNNLVEDAKDCFYDISWFAGEPLLAYKINILTQYHNLYNRIQRFDTVSIGDNFIEGGVVEELIVTFKAIINIINNVWELDERFAKVDIQPRNPFTPYAYNSIRSYHAAKEGLSLVESGVFNFDTLSYAMLTAQSAMDKLLLIPDLASMHKRGFLLSHERYNG